MVGVAQLVELRIVAPAVVGSNPIAHPKQIGPLAQLVEQQTLNLSVRGSSPWRPTNFGLRCARKPFSPHAQPSHAGRIAGRIHGGERLLAACGTVLYNFKSWAKVAEPVDALGLGPSGVLPRESSSLSFRTTQ